jgi:hypothetical protein
MSVGNRVLGLACAFLNSFMSSIGFVLQRKAHLTKGKDSVVSTSRDPIWILGIVLYIAAALPDVWAYTLIPQVLCAAVACFRLVVVCALGHAFLGEHLGRQDAHSIAICTAGTILCVMFGPGSEEKTKASGEIHHPKVVAYSIVGLCVLGIFMVIVHADSFGWVVTSSNLYRFSLPAATALAYAVEKVFNTELGFIQRPENILLEPTWLCMVIAVAALGLTDFYLNTRAAERMPVHLFAPVTFAFATSLQCLQGMLIFDEFSDMSLFCSMMTLLGVGLALAGALMIQPSQFETKDRVPPSPSSKLRTPPSPSSMHRSPSSKETQADRRDVWKCIRRAQRRLTESKRHFKALWLRQFRTHLKESGSKELHLV